MLSRSYLVVLILVELVLTVIQPHYPPFSRRLLNNPSKQVLH